MEPGNQPQSEPEPGSTIRDPVPHSESSPEPPPTVAAGSDRLRAAKPGPGNLGPYRLLEELGRGTFGVVYKAARSGSPQRFAVKVLKDESDWEGLQRFRLEVIVGRKLSHPGIVNVVDAGRDRGAAYAVMDFVPGQTLRQRLKRPLEIREAARVVAAMARAVGYLHEKGVVHRDLKPSNVIMDADSGAPRITDLGLAKDHAEMRLTKTGDGMGTPGYMAPEQFRAARDVDARADVYSLGVILYECLTGERPFTALTFLETMQLVSRGLCAPPRLLNPDVPLELQAICLSAMAVDAAERPATGNELAEALEDWAVGDPGHVDGESEPGRSLSLWVSAGVALLGLVAAAGILSLRTGAQPVAVAVTPPATGPAVSPQPTDGQPFASWPAGPVWKNDPNPPPFVDGESIEGPGWVLACGLSRFELEERVGALKGRGLRPSVLYANSDGDRPRFLAVWTADPEPWELELGLAEDELAAASERRRDEGLSVACMAYYAAPEGNRVAVVWAHTLRPRTASAGLTTLDYQAQFNRSRGQDRQAVWHAALGQGEARRLALVWTEGRQGSFAVHDRPERNFVGTLLGAQARGHVPFCATRYGSPASPLFGGLWQADPGESTVVHDVPAGEHRALVESFREDGFRPLFMLEHGRTDLRFTSSWVRDRERSWQVSGEEVAGLEELDAIVRGLMTDQGVTRGALAVVRGGRLVLARGYTHLPEGAGPTQPYARFRLGALSAPLTAVGALRLVEEGQLELHQSLGEHLPAFQHWTGPTVRELLSHRSGWPSLAELAGPLDYQVRVFNSMILDNEEEPDFAFRRRLPLGTEGLESLLLERPPPPLLPNEWRESDVGYALLARVLSSASRVPYATWIRRQVLDPLGIEGIVPAHSRPSGRLPGEVAPEAPGICRDVLGSGALLPRSYGARDLETFEGYAGWVGSAPELARFGAALTGVDSSLLLGRDAIVEMWSPSSGQAGFGLGWVVDGPASDPLAWATSRLPGASGRLERMPGGTVWVLLLNREAPLDDTAIRIRDVLGR